MPRQDITASLLHAHYPVVQNLISYLVDVLDIEDAVDDDKRLSYLITKVDSPAFHDFMTATMVTTENKPKGRIKIFTPICGMSDVVLQAQRRILRSNETPSILTSGCYLKGNDVCSNGWNTVLGVFENAEWDQLLQRIGVDSMLHLLTSTSIFIPLPNCCLCQLTGGPIVGISLNVGRSVTRETFSHTSIKRTLPLSFVDSDAYPHKRRKLRKRGKILKLRKGTFVKQLSPQEINIARSRLFFSRPSYVPSTDILVVGLPVKHILNRIHPSQSKTKDHLPEVANTDQETITQAKNARHLSKYVFSRQYGLQTPFQFLGKRKENYTTNCLDREEDIKTLGPCKTPKRLQEVLPLLEKLIWRHGKCKYKALVNIACPTKIKKDDGKNLQENVILELMSEQSIQLATQPSLGLDDVSLDSVGNVILPHGSTQALRHVQSKPKFTEFECTHHDVFRYATLVTNEVIPKSFWGSKQNYTLVLRNVKKFIECRRYETFSIHYLLQGFSTAACDWLVPPGAEAQAQGRVSVSDALKRRELLEDFMLWYFDGFLLPLLKTTFYITESSAFRNRILYFRQDDWQALCFPLMKRLVENMFEEIPQSEAQELLRHRSLGYSFVRLLPKDTGVRPIVNLRGSKLSTSPGGYGGTRPSINVTLRAAFDILTYERTTRAHLLGASVLGPDEIYARLKRFKETLPRSGKGELPKLYFVKVDVQACFDSIEQKKLLEILRHLLSKDEYEVYRYGQTQYSARQLRHTFKRKAEPRRKEAHFLKYATDLASELWNTIFVGLPTGRVNSVVEKRKEVLALLEEHITKNMINGKYYTQKVGIPQGSVLSTILCSFFYGDLERTNEEFKRLRIEPGSVLFRLVDDYLFVTTSLPKARSFLSMMNQGHPEYGCFIGKDKTLTNLDYDAQIMNVVDPSSKGFPWCGFLINMRDLSVSVDYSRYAAWGIPNTLTIDRGKKPGSAFRQKMLLLAQAKCHVIYTDAELNPEPVAYLNLYQNMLLVAMKVRDYIRDAKLLLPGNVSFLTKAIRAIVHAAYSSTQQQLKRKAKLNEGKSIPCDIKKPAALWLGYHAFHHVLSRKSQFYKVVLASLEKELKRVQTRGYRRRFRSLVEEGQSAFDFSGAVRV